MQVKNDKAGLLATIRCCKDGAYSPLSALFCWGHIEVWVGL